MNFSLFSGKAFKAIVSWLPHSHSKTFLVKTGLTNVTSASKKNYSSSADLNYHHSINVMNSCPRAATETKRYCVTIDRNILIYRHAYYANL